MTAAEVASPDEGITPLEGALSAARDGFWQFPVYPDGGVDKDGKDRTKTPYLKGWQERATLDPLQIERWAEQFPGCNFGTFTEKFGRDGQALVVGDIDIKNGKRGDKRVLELELEGKEFPATRTHDSPSGGWHWFYVVDKAVKGGVDALGNGIDIKSKGGLVLSPGSWHNGKQYGVRPIEGQRFVGEAARVVQPAPQWLIDACGAPRPKAVDRAPLPGIDPVRARARGIEYLKTAPEAISKARGNITTYEVAAELMDLGNDPATTFDLMASEHWFNGCGWSDDELQTLVDNSEEYMQSRRGSKAPEAAFEAVVVDQSDSATLHPFDEVNREHSVVIAGADGVVYRERSDQMTGQRVFDRMKLQTFKLALADKTFMDGNRVGPLADAWLKSPRRRFYPGGVEFAPTLKVASDVLNLWGGWAVSAAPGDWSLFRQHIRDVVCSGDVESFDYVMGWLGNMVQNPAEPGQVALVLKGGRGTGKSTFGTLIGRIFGRHFLHLNDPNQLTGRFSAHLACKVFVLCDEAVFVGDKSSDPRLKAMITEPTIPLEAKGVDIVSVRNTAHLLLCSNDAWVVRAGAKERRYAVLEMADSVQQNTTYFAALRKQMDSGGLEAMLYDLQRMDLSGFNVWKLPKTAAAVEQQTNSLRGAEAWLFDALNTGWCAGQDWGGAELAVQTNDLYTEYLAKKPKHDYEVANNAFSRAVQDVLNRGSDRVSRKRIKGKWCLVLPALAAARKAFDAFLGASVSWDEVDTGEGGEIGNPAQIFG